MEVMTQKEYQASKGKGTRKRSPSGLKTESEAVVSGVETVPAERTSEDVSEEVQERREILYRFPQASKTGKSSCAFFHGDKEVMVELDCGIFQFSPETPEVERQAFEGVLLRSGFIREERVAGLDQSLAEAASLMAKEAEVKAAKRYEWKIGHGDNTDQNKVTANIGMTVGDREVQVDFVDGFTVTRDEALALALLSRGCYQFAKEEVNDEGKG